MDILTIIISAIAGVGGGFGIAKFIETHQLDADTSIVQANIWSESQRQFLAEKIKSDGEWALVVDQLNESLHEDSTNR